MHVLKGYLGNGNLLSFSLKFTKGIEQVMIYIKDKKSFFRFIAYIIAAVVFTIFFIVVNIKFEVEIVTGYFFVLFCIIEVGILDLFIIAAACVLAKQAFGKK